MVRKIIALLVVLVFGLSGQVFAGGQALSNAEMDEISAGDWVIIDPETQEVVDVYAVNNTLFLLEESQKDIQAVSNANTVDSAIAVQTNVSRVTGDSPTNNVGVNGRNEANIANYRPGESGAEHSASFMGKVDTFTKSNNEYDSESCSFGSQYGSSFSMSSSKSASYSKLLTETLDIAGASAVGGATYGKEIEKLAAASSLVVDGDKYLTESFGYGASCAAGGSKTASKYGSHSSESSKTTVETTIGETYEAEESSSSYHESKGANNHILLDSTSQQSIMAISNLNAVASGAAVQANVASNLGVEGTITHVNIATVVNGLSGL